MVELSRCAAVVFERFGVDCQAAGQRQLLVVNDDNYK
jgi:hypothetical protein